VTLLFMPVINWLPPTISAPFRIAWYIMCSIKLLRLAKTQVH
jgi:hypothetical protein